MTAPARDLAIYDGRCCLVVARNGQARAFDCNGEPLGIFATETDALAALSTVKLAVAQRQS
jgi:hypothetical protein